tara:strand:- start:3234 stop:3581 length:348 start_codon:yes stop_codon:yes gene_type:complete
MNERDCIFCGISQGEITSNKIFEDDQAFAILDISPKAPEHVLVIPHIHVGDLINASLPEFKAARHCFEIAPQIAKSRGLGLSGYRLVTNQGSDSGQEVPHFHLHILGGRKLQGMG